MSRSAGTSPDMVSTKSRDAAGAVVHIFTDAAF
jgi:hypothetical protein